MFHDGGFLMGGMHFLWWIFWLVLIAVIVFFGWGRPSERRRRSSETPHETLQKRLASGAITSDQYSERKALLDRDAGGQP